MKHFLCVLLVMCCHVAANAESDTIKTPENNPTLEDLVSMGWNEGYTFPFKALEHKALQQGGVYSFNVPTYKGSEYLILARCDENCTRLDIKPYPAAQAPFVSGGVNYKGLYFTSDFQAQADKHVVDIIMQECKAESCEFSVVIGEK